MNPTPKISIVTPSYNQGEFLAAAMHSVIDQNYPNLEYVVMDGGSTDGSLEIIKKYEKHLAFWASGPDGGHYEALNKGFAKTTGEIMAWINSDDKYLPWTFSVVAEIFSSFPQVEWLTTLYPVLWDEDGRAVECRYVDGYSRLGFLRGEFLPRGKGYAKDFIQQESTFWRRSLWERAGGRLNSDLKFAADFELWARFYQHAELYGVNTTLGGFRCHPKQKTARFINEYTQEACSILAQHNGRPYGTFESLVRPQLQRIFPQRLRRLAVMLKVRHPQKQCLRIGRLPGWKVVEE